MIIIKNSSLPHIFSYIFGEGCQSVFLFPFIFMCKSICIKPNDSLIRKNEIYRLQTRIINHERIHFYQCMELGIVGFYILYILNFIINIFYYLDVNKAYRNICFEREAYLCDEIHNYHVERKMFTFIQLIFNDKLTSLTSSKNTFYMLTKIKPFCSICLTNEKCKYILHTTSSNVQHKFHQICIMNYWISKNKPKILPCPLCKEKITFYD